MLHNNLGGQSQSITRVIEYVSFRRKPNVPLLHRSIKEGSIAEGPVNSYSLSKKFSAIHPGYCSLCFLKILIFNKCIPLINKKFHKFTKEQSLHTFDKEANRIIFYCQIDISRKNARNKYIVYSNHLTNKF